METAMLVARFIAVIAFIIIITFYTDEKNKNIIDNATNEDLFWIRRLIDMLEKQVSRERTTKRINISMGEVTAMHVLLSLKALLEDHYALKRLLSRKEEE